MSLIRDKSTRFYHLVPHVLKFGETLPLLKTEEMVKAKIEVVDQLIEIETAYSILDGVKGNISNAHQKIHSNK